MSYRDYNAQVSSCMFSCDVSKNENPWMHEKRSSRVAPADGSFSKDVSNKQPLREKNRKSCGYRHVPHKDKPAQVVARRNARERRRVHAVNTAFVRLRKAVPIQNVRGKRVSKVKTLQHAIDYIRALQRILQEHGNCGSSYAMNKYFHYKQEDYFQDQDINYEEF